mmetsp:Transcript_4935/g.12295  ORF Transcript_4935/g.12295 Transcript_4935/m.12295 type:complete len:82 (+) Transcript_4935:814-1059(+)
MIYLSFYFSSLLSLLDPFRKLLASFLSSFRALHLRLPSPSVLLLYDLFSFCCASCVLRRGDRKISERKRPAYALFRTIIES